MTTRLQVIFEARKWLRTPYRHQGRNLGLAADCLFLLCVCEALGILDKYGVPIKGKDYLEYTEKASRELSFIHEEAVRRLIRKPASDLQPGDFVTLRYGAKIVSHCGIIADFRTPNYKTLTLIHCTEKGVAECGLDRGWRQRIVGAFSFPDVH